MIEKDLLSVLTDYKCFTERPPKAPKQWVLLERIGQSCEEHGILYRSRFAVQSYADSLLNAAELDEQVKNTLLSAEHHNISSIKINSSSNFTDPETKEYRYQSVYDIVHY